MEDAGDEDDGEEYEESGDLALAELVVDLFIRRHWALFVAGFDVVEEVEAEFEVGTFELFG